MHVSRLFVERVFQSHFETLHRCVRAASLRAPNIPTVVFVGRSNVGKSSLVTRILPNVEGRIATSKTPGRTRSLDFFGIRNGRYAQKFLLADVPGYGFIQSAQQIDHLSELLRAVVDLPSVSLCMVLIDARRGLMPVDFEAMDSLTAAGKRFQIVLTKIDKVSPTKVHTMIESMRATLSEIYGDFLVPEILRTSSRTDDGIHETRLSILRAVALDSEG